MTIVNSYTELLALDAEDFVCAAYQVVLARAPDQVGLAYYLARLRIGYSKFSILNQLGTSGEPRSWDALPGLSQAMRRYRMGLWPIVGWIFRRFWRVEGESVGERLQRAIVINFAAANADLERRVTAEVRGVADIHSKLCAAAAAAAFPSGVGDPSDSKQPYPRNLVAERLSPRAREAFNQLVSG